jgi:hypothetical protein
MSTREELVKAVEDAKDSYDAIVAAGESWADAKEFSAAYAVWRVASVALMDYDEENTWLNY